MDHDDHVRLIRAGVEGAGSTWADLGSGTGAFTLALADELGPSGIIHSIDRDGAALRVQAQTVHRRFPATTLELRVADFTKPLALPPLDGVLMANSLHFVRDKAPVLGLVRDLLRPGGHLVLVEYDADRGNHWVPFPISSQTWRAMGTSAGFVDTRELARVPSRFLGAIYSAISKRPAEEL